MSLDAPLEYARRHQLHALVVAQNGTVVFEQYAEGFTAERSHALYSGAKSFWGVAAVAAQEDGLLFLDEPVAHTIASWRDDSAKSRVTLRQLLQLTSGIPFGGLGRAVPTFERALSSDVTAAPGTKFTYGGIPLQVFGAVLQRKLAGQHLSPHGSLKERILDPIGMRIDRWRTLADGSNPMPTGAFVTASEWLKFGALILQQGRWNNGSLVGTQSLAACFQGSQANPKYGLGFWLSPVENPPGIVYASGAGGQALYYSFLANDCGAFRKQCIVSPRHVC
ncbi:MAG: serine hydrolase [Candidatus Eremiobacteraeota bacterium]|nr:serine hydrolase [Candidatus Eremiobacteraeota bacterium]